MPVFDPDIFDPELFDTEPEVVGTHVIDVADVIDFLSSNDKTLAVLEAHEEFIGDLIDEVFAEFVEATGQPIEQDEEYVYPFRGRGKDFHVPPFKKVNGISRLERWTGTAWEDVDTAIYRGDDSDGFFLIDGDFVFVQNGRYRATLDVGYAVIPADILDMVKYKTIERYFDSPKGRNRFQMESEASTTSVSVTLKYDRVTLQAQWDKVVKKYTPIG